MSQECQTLVLISSRSPLSRVLFSHICYISDICQIAMTHAYGKIEQHMKRQGKVSFIYVFICDRDWSQIQKSCQENTGSSDRKVSESSFIYLWTSFNNFQPFFPIILSPSDGCKSAFTYGSMERNGRITRAFFGNLLRGYDQ